MVSNSFATEYGLASSAVAPAGAGSDRVPGSDIVRGQDDGAKRVACLASDPGAGAIAAESGGADVEDDQICEAFAAICPASSPSAATSTVQSAVESSTRRTWRIRGSGSDTMASAFSSCPRILRARGLQNVKR